MAISNMVVTVVANTTKFASGMKKAASQTTSFGRIAKVGFGLAATAIAGIGLAILRAIPDFIKLGVESRRASVRLQYMAENVAGLGKATDETVARLSAYADQVAYATGVDDEQIMAIQAKLMVFKQLSKTASQLGGMFDRVTKAAIDLAALGFGEAETNAVKLARMMQSPIDNLNLLNRMGIVFTDQEKKKAAAIEQTNGKMAASDYLMGIIESKVGGLAEKTADPLAIIGLAFQNIGEHIATEALPYIDDLKNKIIEWIQSPGGQKAIQDVADSFGDFVSWLSSKAGQQAIKDWMENALKVGDALVRIADVVLWLAGPGAANMEKFNRSMDFSGMGSGAPSGTGPIWSQGTGGSSNNSGGGNGSSYLNGGYGSTRISGDKASIVVNFNAPVDSVSAGREVARVLADYDRANGRR